jgi:hypothetical protein
MPGIRISGVGDVHPHTTSGTIHWITYQTLPNISGKVVWRFDNWNFRAYLTLTDTGAYSISHFLTAFHWRSGSFRARFGLEFERPSIAAIARFRFPRADFGLRFCDSQLIISAAVVLTQRCRVGLRTAVRRSDVLGGLIGGAAVGFATQTDRGRLKFALQAQSKVAMAKWKTEIPLGELATILAADEFRLGKWRMGVSSCMKPEALQAAMGRND